MTHQKNTFYQTTTQSPLGSITIISDQLYVYLVKFSDTPNLKNTIQKLCKNYDATLVWGITNTSTNLETELQLYFNGQLKKFTTPLFLTGTIFQKNVWEQLNAIDYGATCSYSQQATTIKQASAIRAVAKANASNPIIIVIPCHRVIGKNGNITGYNGGIHRKEWLLQHEQKYTQS